MIGRDHRQESRLVNIFEGVKFKWVLFSSRIERPISNKNRDGYAHEWSDVKHFELSFHKKQGYGTGILPSNG